MELKNLKLSIEDLKVKNACSPSLGILQSRGKEKDISLQNCYTSNGFQDLIWTFKVFEGQDFKHIQEYLYECLISADKIYGGYNSHLYSALKAYYKDELTNEEKKEYRSTLRDLGNTAGKHTGYPRRSQPVCYFFNNSLTIPVILLKVAPTEGLKNTLEQTFTKLFLNEKTSEF